MRILDIDGMDTKETIKQFKFTKSSRGAVVDYHIFYMGTSIIFMEKVN